MYIEVYPDLFELINFFNSEPEIDTVDGIYKYSIVDSRGIELIFFFSILDGKVSIFIYKDGSLICRNEIENVKNFKIVDDDDKKYIHISPVNETSNIDIHVGVSPQISVKINSLSA